MACSTDNFSEYILKLIYVKIDGGLIVEYTLDGSLSRGMMSCLGHDIIFRGPITISYNVSIQLRGHQ